MTTTVIMPRIATIQTITRQPTPIGKYVLPGVRLRNFHLKGQDGRDERGFECPMQKVPAYTQIENVVVRMQGKMAKMRST